MPPRVSKRICVILAAPLRHFPFVGCQWSDSSKRQETEAARTQSLESSRLSPITSPEAIQQEQSWQVAIRRPTNATPSARSAGPPVTAPDGIVVYPIDLTPCAHLALAEGDIQPGHTYGIHAHLTLEQVTYVLSGRVRAITHDPNTGQTHEIQAAAGDSVITRPGHSLQFAAAGDTPARVLFITSPPYPADHSDTVTLDTHRELDKPESARMPERRAAILRAFGGIPTESDPDANSAES